MDVAAAQRDMTAAYVGGAPGVLVSGIVWLIAGFVGLQQPPGVAFTILFFGGMAIFPLGVLIARVVFRAGKVSPGNPLNRLGIESTIVLFAGILVAWVLLRHASSLALPALAIAVGARYFSFRTMYDEVVFWILGGVLMLIGAGAMLRPPATPGVAALEVGAAECVFALVLLMRWRRERV
jgi:hypothetical protein